MMESHVLPTILIYHMGIDINKGANAGDRTRASPPIPRGGTTSRATCISA